MKKLVKFSTLILMLVVAVIFAGCKDDKNEPTENYAGKVVGTYVGTLASATMSTMNDVPLVVDSVGNNKVTVSISVPMAGVVTCNADVKKSGNGYAITGSEDVTVQGITALVTFNGSITELGSANFNINVALPAPAPPMTFTFVGEKVIVLIEE